MHDTAVVGRLERCGDLLGDLHGLVRWDGPAHQSFLEILAGDQLHRQEALSLGLVKTIDGGDVGMLERGQQLGLTLETRQPLGVLHEHLGQHLDRDFAVECAVDRFPHHAHPTFTDLLDQAVVE